MASIVGASRLAAILTLDVKPFIRNTELAATALEKFREKAQALGSTLGRSLGVALGLLGGAAIRVSSEFNKIESQLRAVGTGDNIDSIVAKAKQLGIETMFTATEVLELGLELKKLGFDAQATNEALETSVKITQVFGGSLSQVGTSVAETQRQFQGANGELRSFAEIGDIFATAFASTALDSSNLAGALKNVGSVASIAGYSIEETVALLGLLANSGQKAGRSGTRLKGVFLELGTEFGFTGQELSALTAGNLDIAKTFEILHKRAGVAGAVIGKMGLEFYNLVVRLEDAEGALDAMNEGLEDQLFIQVEKNTNAIQTMGRVLGEALTPYVRTSASVLGDLAESFEKADGNTKSMIGRFTIMGVVIPVVTAALAALAGALQFIIANPIIFGLTALTSAFIAFQLQQAENKGLLDAVNESLSSFKDLLKETDDELTSLSLPVLQTELEESQKALEAAEEAQRRLLYDSDTGRRLTDEEAFIEVYKAQVGFLDKIYRSSERTKELRAQAGAELERILTADVALREQVLALEEAIADKEGILAFEAQERYFYAQKTGEALLSQQESLTAIQGDADKIKTKFKEAFAVFGEETNNFENVAGIINQINDAKLLDIFENGLPGDLDSILKSGGLDAQINLLKAVSDEFARLAILASEKGLQGTAASLNKFADQYKDQLEKLKLDKSLSEILTDRIDEDASTQLLKDLGVYDLEASLKKELSAAKKALSSLIDLGSTDSSVTNEIIRLQEEIRNLDREIERTNLQKKVDAILNPPGRISATDAFAAAIGASGTEGFTRADELSKELRKLEVDFKKLYDLLNPKDPDAVSVGTQEALDNLVARYRAARNQLDEELRINEFNDALRQLNQADAVLEMDKKLGLLDRDGIRSAEIANLTARIRLLATAPEGVNFAAYDQLQDKLQVLQQEAQNVANASTLVTFFNQQVSFLGEAFVSAAKDGANFWQTLKESLLNTFYALVAKLITLITLYTILLIVSGGTSAAAGAAGSAIEGGFGTFLAEGLTGLNLRSGTTASSSATVAAGGTGTAGVVRIGGSISGNDVVISNQRGTRAIDRTFG